MRDMSEQKERAISHTKEKSARRQRHQPLTATHASALHGLKLTFGIGYSEGKRLAAGALLRFGFDGAQKFLYLHTRHPCGSVATHNLNIMAGGIRPTTKASAHVLSSIYQPELAVMPRP